ncbi:MAG: bifunctional metallophosphatase/5'-nucleotidase [Candidatus Cloacimonetes bacterium]|nr:bifunctional metallophosphatase/5'-nucleotidase [Candidatus Cloacimonadota bacterium]
MRCFLAFSLLLTLTCGLAAEDLILDILWSNDIHGGIDPYPATFMNPQFPPMLGGGGSAGTYIRSARALSENDPGRANLLLDIGDFFQGHPIGTVTEGRAVIKYMNMVGYDLTAIGNHEYDIGEEKLIETYKLAEFPVLSCNVYRRGTDDLVEYAIPYLIFEKLGLRIAVIGLTTTDTAQMSIPEHIENVEFRNAKEALERYIPLVQEQERADIVIVAGHMGLPYEPEPAYQRRYVDRPETTEPRRWGYDAQELAHEVQGIDLFVGGHMHKGFQQPWVDPVTHTLVVQGYAYGSNVGHLILRIDPETKSVTGWDSPAEGEILVTMMQDTFIPEPTIHDSILAMQARAESGMDEVIGEATVHLTRIGDAQSRMGNLVVDAMLVETGADFAFLNLGGVRADIAAGPVTYRNVFDVLPFDSQLVVFEADGAFLKQIIEKRIEGSRHGLRVAGVRVVNNRERPDFDRVVTLEVGGEPLDYDRTYRIATSDFLMQGNAGLTMLPKVPEEQITRYETILRDVVVEYIRKYSPVTAEIDDRWRRDDSMPKADYLR